MRAWQVPDLGENPVLHDIAEPTPVKGEIVVGVEAVGLNFADMLAIQGKYQVKQVPPYTPGMELAGTVVALGPGARRPTETAAAPAIPASATALAPTGLRTTVPGLEPMGDRPAAQAAIRPGRAQPQPQAPAAEEEGESGAPLQLPGVITTGPKPGAQAAIRPRTAPAAQAKPADAKKVAQAGKSQPVAAKAQPKKEPAKARPKAKPQDDE